MSKSLGELLSQQKSLIDKLETSLNDMPEEAEEIELALDQLIGDIREKVDATKYVIDTIEAAIKAEDEKWIKPLQRRQKAMKNVVKRIKDYVKFQMQQGDFQKLPGMAFSASLQKSTPEVLTDREPLPQDFLAYPEFVIQDVSYRWDKKKIKEAINAGAKLSFARLSETISLRFYPANKSLKNPKGDAT